MSWVPHSCHQTLTELRSIQDLQFWYSEGPGQPTAAAQGIGYVQEVVSRLTRTPIAVADSTTNGTLDQNNITFPLDQPM